ncbi:MAG: NUDIX domain-containing protein [Bacteroidota bacterium]
MDIIDFLENGGKQYLPHLSIDVVIIGYEEHTLKCLLLQIGDKWVLPGGYIGKDESTQNAARRILLERTALETARLSFLAVFGNENRSFGEQFKRYAIGKGISWKEEYWVNSRFVTLSHYALVNLQQTHPLPGEFDDAIRWFSFDSLPEMWLDHKNIVREARKRIKQDVLDGYTCHDLLAGKFTMPELHVLHQIILEQDLDRSRFQKKMLSSGKFKRLPKLQKSTPGRNPFLYKSIEGK